jgi:hypothetical protein
MRSYFTTQENWNQHVQPIKAGYRKYGADPIEKIKDTGRKIRVNLSLES